MPQLSPAPRKPTIGKRRRPASGTITGVFEIGHEKLAEIRREVNELGKNSYHFEAGLVDEEGTMVARVHKEVYVRAKATRP